MLAKKYKAQIVSIENSIKGVYTLEIKSLGRKFKYAPGQFLHLAIDKDYDGVGQWPESRCFSMQSCPTDENIKITYSVVGAFTRQMEIELCVGSEVWIKLPYGELFAQEHNKKDTVFISGGTGITPYLSLFTDASFLDYENSQFFCGFKNRSYNLYSSVLKSLKNANVNTYYEDEQGYININDIPVSNETSYFISGPPEMIYYFKEELLKKQVPETNILTDDWE